MKTLIQRDMAALHVKFDKLIDILIQDRNSFIEKSENDMLENKKYEKDIEQMKPLITELDIDKLEKNMSNETFKVTFVSVFLFYI